MNPNDDLLNDMLDDAAGPAAPSLEFTLRAVRGRRRRALLSRVGLAVILLAVCMPLVFHHDNQSHRSIAPAATGKIAMDVSPSQPPDRLPLDMSSLTDDELLARFPHMAVALISRGDQTQLVFLSAGTGATTTPLAD